MDLDSSASAHQSNADGVREPMNQQHKDSTKSFANPNFSLSDSEDEDLWPQRKPNGTAKNAPIS